MTKSKNRLEALPTPSISEVTRSSHELEDEPEEGLPRKKQKSTADGTTPNAQEQDKTSITNQRYEALLNDHITDSLSCPKAVASPELSDLQEGHIGGTVWRIAGKEMFFAALTRHGRNFGAISKAVNKSVLEVSRYNDVLEEELKAAKLFGISIEEFAIDSAIETSTENETICEAAADAILRQQHLDDVAREHEISGEVYLLEDDQGNEDHDDDQVDAEKQATTAQMIESDLIDQDSLLRLSKYLFLNSSDPDLHWASHISQSAIQQDGPAIFRSAYNDLTDLVKGVARRIITAAYHQTLSHTRISRADQTISDIPTITEDDMLAAINILDLPRDSWNYWASLPKRHCANWVYEIGSAGGDGGSQVEELDISKDSAERCLRTFQDDKPGLSFLEIFLDAREKERRPFAMDASADFNGAESRPDQDIEDEDEDLYDSEDEIRDARLEALDGERSKAENAALLTLLADGNEPATIDASSEDEDPSDDDETEGEDVLPAPKQTVSPVQRASAFHNSESSSSDSEQSHGENFVGARKVPIPSQQSSIRSTSSSEDSSSEDDSSEQSESD